MRQLLIRHPDSHVSAASQIEVDVIRPHVERLELSYVVTGDTEKIRIPPLTRAMRTDELWRHTCFEAFVGTPADPAYYEFNFAPSTQWAVYRFTNYRNGMRAADEISELPIEVRASDDSFTLRTSLELKGLSGLPRLSAWRLGLSAVIEDTSGRMSYWALAHPPGKPDFHHAACFAHEIAVG